MGFFDFWNRPRVCRPTMLLQQLEERVVFDAAVTPVDQQNQDTTAISPADQTDSVGTAGPDAGVQGSAADAADSAGQLGEVFNQDLNAVLISNSPDAVLSVAGSDDGSVDAGVHVLVIPSTLQGADQLAAAAQQGVITVRYDAAQGTLSELLASLQTALAGEQADTIAFASHNSGEAQFHLVGDYLVNPSSLLSNAKVQSFWTGVGQLLNENGRVDLLACHLVGTDAGELLISQIEDLTGHLVAASDDATGNPAAGGDWVLETANVDLLTVYFVPSQVQAFPGILISTQEFSNPAAEAHEFFGSSVAISGDWAIVGASGDPDFDDEYDEWDIPGSAYMYHFNGSSWAFTQELPNPAPADEDRFGGSVAISGDWAIVGAYLDDQGAYNAGSAYVYHFNGTNWENTQALANPTPGYFDSFGGSVAISGDWAIVGAQNAESAYMYHLNGMNWENTQELAAPAVGHFGHSVAISGDDWVIVGALNDDFGASNAGSAYIYYFSGVNWYPLQTLRNPAPATNEHFGVSVAISGDYAIIGAYGDTVGGAYGAGSAYMYHYVSGTGWENTQALPNPTPAYQDGFGGSVAIFGDEAVVGALYDNPGGVENAGSAYRYHFNGTSWVNTQTMTAPAPGAGEDFGWSVSISGDRVIAGAPYDNPGGVEDAGTAYVIEPNTAPTVQAPIPDVTVSEDAADTVFSVYPHFQDTEDTDVQLQYTVANNTNSGLFSAVTIDGSGNLHLDYAPDAYGVADMTIRATDTGGLYVQDTFHVTVNAVNEAPVLSLNTNAGALDPAFDGDGKLATDLGYLGYSDMQANATAIQADGKIVVAGEALYSGQDMCFVVLRYNSDGSLDSTFSGDGIAESWGGRGQSVAIQADGKIVVAGVDGNSVKVLRLTTDGELDSTFSGDGVAANYMGCVAADHWSVAIQADGNIVVAGTNGSDFAVARYTTTGDLDNTFDTDGKLTTDFAGSTDKAHSVAIDANGKIVVAGSAFMTWSDDFAVARYNTDGTLDTTFSDDGKATKNLMGNADVGYSVAIQSDGKIVVAGFGDNADNGGGPALVRYNSNGTLDTTFGYSGIWSWDDNDTKLYSVALQADGKIVAVSADNPDYRDFFLFRFNANGGFDSSFGDTQTNIGGYDQAYAVAIQADGKIVVAGESSGQFAVARYDASQMQYNTGGGAKIIDANITLTDADSANMTGATVVISGNYQSGQDTLAIAAGYTLPSGVSALWNGSTHTLTISGSATKAQYEAILEHVTYSNSSGSPNEDPRTLSWTVSDGTSNSVTKASTITIAAASNNAPTVEAPIADVTVDEDAADTVFSLYPHFQDAETADGDLAYTVTGNTNSALFTAVDISDPTQFRLDYAPDANGSADITIRATDSGGLWVEDTFHVTVSAVNDDPTDISLSNNTIAENAGVNAVVGTLAATDPDTGESFTYTLVSGEGDTGNGFFNIAGNTLRANDSFDHETGPASYSIRVEVTDSGGLTHEEQFIIDVTDVNETPTDISLSSSTIEEHAGVNAVVGTLAGTDPDTGDSFTYTLASGEGDSGNSFFNISGNELRANDSFDYDTGPHSYSVRVQVTDSGDLTHQEQFTIYVTQENEPPVLTLVSAPGDLDPTFDHDGIVLADLGGLQVSSMAIQSDGKIVVAGSAFSDSTSDNFAVARFNPDGSLDTSFGVGGWVTTDIAGRQDYAFSVAIDADGKIVVAGRANTRAYIADYDVTVVRYNADGTLDTSFGNAGIVVTDMGTDYDTGQSVTIDADGRIVVAGSTDNGSSQDIAVLRYNPDGSLDGSFDTDGIVTTDFDGNDDGAYAVAVDADSKIVVTGYTDTGTGYDLAVARYNPDGSLDATFDTDGKVTTGIGTDAIAASVAIQSDGKILVAAGVDTGPNWDFALVRYNPDGSLDDGFDGDGIVTTDFAGGDDVLHSLAIQSDDKIVVAGYTDLGSKYDFALARYNTDGTLDASFGTGGKVTTSAMDPFSRATSVAIQSDGKIVAAGSAYDGSVAYVALARYTQSEPSSMAYTENDGPRVIDGSVTITDDDSTDMASATIQITGNVQEGEDILGIEASYVLPTDVSWSWDGEKLTVTGLASNADYESILEHVTYTNTSDDPNTGDRTVTWIVNDGTSDSALKTSTITITALNDAPTGIVLNDSSVAENEAIGTLVGNFSATDVDSGDIHTYTLVSGEGDDDNASFALAPDGTLKTNAVFDHETKDSYSIRVRTTDSGGSWIEEAFIITITDGNDAPTSSGVDDPPAQPEDFGTFMYDVSGFFTDPDVPTTLAYELGTATYHDGLSLSGVSIDSATGEVTFLSALDSNGSVDVQVRAYDGELYSDWQTFTLTVNPGNETPVVDLDETAGGTGFETTFTEGGGRVRISSTNVDVSDVDDTNIESATFTLVNQPNGTADRLQFVGTLPSGFTRSWDSTTWVLTITGPGTLAQYETFIERVWYNNTSQNPDTADRTVEVAVNDGDGNSAAAVSTIHVVGVNDAPTVHAPAAAEMEEDGTFTFTNSVDPSTRIWFTDVDSLAANQIVVTLDLQDDHGLLHIANVTGLTFLNGTTNDSSHIEIQGARNVVNARLNGMQFIPTDDFNGSDVLAVTVNDLGFTGTGGPLEGTQSIPITVTPVNDAPEATNLNQSHTVVEDSGALNLTNIVVSDGDDGVHGYTETVTATLRLNNRLAGSLSANDGATYAAGVWRITGDVAHVNTALANVTFTPASNWSGSTTITTHVEDAAGTGPADGAIAITVNGANDAPVITVSGAQSVVGNTYLNFGTSISVSDPDAGNGLLQVTLSVQHGTLNLVTRTGLTFSGCDGIWDSTVTFRGTLANINAALHSLQYRTVWGYSGADSLSIFVNDQGNTGGAAQTDNDSVGINVLAPTYWGRQRW